MAGEVRLGRGRERAAKPGQMVADDVDVAVDEPPPLRLARRASSSPTRSTRSASTSPAAARSTSAPRPAASPTACCSAAPRTSSRVDVAYGELDWRLRNDDRVTVLERTNARALSPADLPYAPDLRRRRRLVHLADARCCRRVLGCAAPRFDALAMVKPQFEVGPRARRQGRRRARAGRPARSRRRRRRPPRSELGASVLAFASSGLPGPKGNRETFALARRGRPRRARSRTSRPPRAEVEPA